MWCWFVAAIALLSTYMLQFDEKATSTDCFWNLRCVTNLHVSRIPISDKEHYLHVTRLGPATYIQNDVDIKLYDIVRHIGFLVSDSLFALVVEIARVYCIPGN